MDRSHALRVGELALDRDAQTEYLPSNFYIERLVAVSLIQTDLMVRILRLTPIGMDCVL